MPSTPTDNLGLEKQATGENENTWGTILNANDDILDRAIADVRTKSVAGGIDVTLTTTEAQSAILHLTGTLTANINVIVPTAEKSWLIFNNTSDAFTLTVKTSAGTGIAVTQGKKATVYCDGTDVVDVLSVLDLAAANLVIGTDVLAPAGVGSALTGIYGYQLIDTQTASSSSSLDFVTGIDSTYDQYIAVLIDVLPATDSSVLWTRVSDDAGSTFKSGATDYEYNFVQYRSSQAALANEGFSAGDTKIVLTADCGNAAGEGVSGIIVFPAPSAAAPQKAQIRELTGIDGGATPKSFFMIGGGMYNGSTVVIDGFRFLFSTGDIASGTIALYGLRK